MSDQDSPSSPSTDDLVEKIHDIQEEIFDREDQIDELLDATDSQEPLLTTVEEGKSYRRRLHLKRMRTDWDRMVDRSRTVNGDNDFELAAALVHFVGDILMSQPQGTDARWIEQLKDYIRAHREPVN